MRIVIEVINGVIENIETDQPISDVEFIVMTDNLENAQPDVISRADGQDVLIYRSEARHISDRRYWRDIEAGVKKTDKDYQRAYPDTEGYIEGEAVEVIGKDRRLPCA